MAVTKPLSFEIDPTTLPADPAERHEVVVDVFGRFLLWLRNWSLQSTKERVESEQAREKLGSIRGRLYEAVAAFAPQDRAAALAMTEEVLNTFCERLAYSLGDEGIDAKLGPGYAYRFRVTLEIVDDATGRIANEEAVNRGGKFFGSYWGRWLNRFANT
jgi:hypothetical protein